MKKFRNVPAILTLLAGFVVCIIMIINKYSLVEFLWRLIFVMVAFFAFGLLLQLILNIAFKDAEESSESDEENENTEEDSEGMTEEGREEEQNGSV